jgi:hypothetical protein
LEEFERFDRERKSGVPSNRRGVGGAAARSSTASSSSLPPSFARHRGGISPSIRSAGIGSNSSNNVGDDDGGSSATAAAASDRFTARGEYVQSYDIDEPISEEEYARLLRLQEDRRTGRTGTPSSAFIDAAIQRRGVPLQRSTLPRSSGNTATSSSSASSQPPVVTSYNIDRPILNDDDDDMEEDDEANSYGDNDDMVNPTNNTNNDDDNDVNYEYEPEWEPTDSYLVGARTDDGTPLASAPQRPHVHDDEIDDDDNDDQIDNETIPVAAAAAATNDDVGQQTKKDQ